MNLKEAFAYRNFLSSMFSELKREAMATDAFCVIKEEHLKSKADPGAENEIRDSKSGTLQTSINMFETPSELAQVDPDKIITALETLKDEIGWIDLKIVAAKERADTNIDVLVATNKIVRQLAEVLNTALKNKTTEMRREAIGYKIIESGERAGEQVAYRYPIKEVTSIDFDRKEYRKLADKYNAEIEARSYEIDELMLTIKIDHDPRFSKSDTLQDIIDSVG